MRQVEISRRTSETTIELVLNLDGTGKSNIKTGCGFMDHMLTLFARHGSFDLDVSCQGDTYVDDHHTVEDIGICLGKAFSEALGEKRGIKRYGNIIMPMDEALILCAIDISGRSYLDYKFSFKTEKVGTFDVQLSEEFFIAFVRSAEITLHLRQLAGTNSHHIIEGSFKALARALSEAVAIDSSRAGEIPSTKGVL